MAIAFTAATTSPTNVVVDPSTAAGQFIIAGYADDDSPINPIAMPAGWVQEDNVYAIGDGGNTAVCYTLSSVGGGGNLTFQNAGAACLVLAAYTGVDTGTPFDVTPQHTPSNSGTGSTWTVIAPSVTTVTNGCEIVVEIGFDADPPINITNASAPGLTLRGIANSTAFGGGFANVVTLSGPQAAMGPTGTITVTVTLSSTNPGGWVVYTLALRPAAAVGGCSFPAAAMHYVTP
jgi:hypothetical protein